MAKLFKTSIFLLLAAFLLIAEANHHEDHKKKSHKSDDDDSDHDDNSDDESGVIPKFNLQLKGILPKLRSGGSSGRKKGGSEGGGEGGGESGSANGSGDEGCKCNDAKVKEAVKKVTTLYRAYASKELAPELKTVFGKLGDFTMSYLAKEKPKEVNKFHNFLQNSAKRTGGAIAEVAAPVMH